MSDSAGKKQLATKVVRTIVGGVVLLVGIVAIPYPGPGWLIVFAGLAILARDYPTARRALDYGRKKYDNWQSWLAKQSYAIKVVFWILTSILVVVTIWLLNGYGLINTFLHLGLDWVESPFVK